MEVKGLFIPAAVLSEKALKPISKMIYGLISFREQGSYGACTESAKSMADTLGVSTITIKREVAALENAGYIKKGVSLGRGWKLQTSDKLAPVSDCYQYQNDTTPVSDCYHSGINLISNQYQNDTQRKEEETREDTKEETKKKQGDNSPRGKKAPPFSSLPDGEVKAALMDYVEVRKGSKSPIKTERQERLLLNKLEELSGGDTAKKVKIIEAATVAGWKSFYPLKEETKIQKQQQQGNNGHSESFKQLLDDIEYAKNRPKPWEKRRLQQEESESAKKLDADLEYYETHQVYPWEVQKNDNDKKEL